LIGAAALAPVAMGGPPGWLRTTEEAPATAGTTVTLQVDLGARRLTVRENGQVIRTYVVGVGKPGHLTPEGSYDVRTIQWNPSWVPPDSDWAQGLEPRGPGDPQNPMGQVKIFFREPAYYIHGTPNEESLGGAVSHGCIRMSNADVVELARLLMETSGEDRPESWYDRVLGRPTRTDEVTLPRSVRLTVEG
jgi:lipoprotein-anchoring transpeptidase ErfK/SrfK